MVLLPADGQCDKDFERWIDTPWRWIGTFQFFGPLPLLPIPHQRPERDRSEVTKRLHTLRWATHIDTPNAPQQSLFREKTRKKPVCGEKICGRGAISRLPPYAAWEAHKSATGADDKDSLLAPGKAIKDVYGMGKA
jgi:hypothetical protein